MNNSRLRSRPFSCNYLGRRAAVLVFSRNSFAAGLEQYLVSEFNETSLFVSFTRVKIDRCHLSSSVVGHYPLGSCLAITSQLGADRRLRNARFVIFHPISHLTPFDALVYRFIIALV